MSNMRKVLLPALLLPALLGAQQVRVTGVAFDSLSGRPLPVAFVTLGSKSAIADSLGRFAFDSAAPGTYRVTLQHDMLDSLGLSGIATTVTVAAGMAPLRVATPSVMTMWRRVCPGEAPPDSGFVFGTVLDAATRAPVGGAPIVASWVDIQAVGQRAVSGKEWRLASTTNADGSFLLCGVPLGTGVRLESSRDSVVATSLDLLLSRAAPVRRQDLSLPTDRVRGVVRGVVRSAGKPVGNARITIGSGADVRSAANGSFIAVGVPAGTQQADVSAIGYSEVKHIINVRANDTLDLSLELERIVVLDSVTVRGSVARTRLANQFAERARGPRGYIRDSLQLAKKQSFEGVFNTMASVTMQRPRGLPTISMGARCPNAIVFVDRMRRDADQLVNMRPSDLAGLEVYRPGEMPSDLATLLGLRPEAPPCAVVAWTKMMWR
jgi:hypothetical protein